MQRGVAGESSGAAIPPGAQEGSLRCRPSRGVHRERQERRDRVGLTREAYMMSTGGVVPGSSCRI
jgi:hypothetical protein